MDTGTITLSDGTDVSWQDRNPMAPQDAMEQRGDLAAQSKYRVGMIRDNDDDTATLRVYWVRGSSLDAFFNDPNGAPRQPGQILTVAYDDELPIDTRKTAHHEAGHAVACCEWDMDFHPVEVFTCPVDGKGGRFEFSRWADPGEGKDWLAWETDPITGQIGVLGGRQDGRDLVRREIAIFLAGPEAERRYLGLTSGPPGVAQEKSIALSGAADLQNACDTLARLVPPWGAEIQYQLWEEGRTAALALVGKRWQQIAAVATGLEAAEPNEDGRHRLTADEVRAIIATTEAEE